MMKAFVSVDLEGMPYIVSRGHLLLKGKLYDEARKIATKVTMAAVGELHEKGFEEVVIADSHGPMVNLLVEDLPEYAEIVRGFPRPLNMVSGVEGCNCAVFLGYHAKYGTAKATFDHTFMGASINKVRVNSVEVSEFLINAYAAGEMGVPVILVAGDAQLLADDVKKHAPWAETVALKRSLSRVSARSFGMPRIEKDLKKAVDKAAVSFRKGKAKTLLPEKPVKIEVTFVASHFADIAELSPTVKRTDGLNVEYVAKNFVEAYKTFELLSLASSAMVSILENQV